MTELITAPWTQDQADALNAYQWRPGSQPFQCELLATHPTNDGILYAQTTGWTCPVTACPYVQDWAYDYMAVWPEEG